MFRPILILFLFLASFFLNAAADARKLGGDDDGAQQKYMGHIERYTPNAKPPEGSSLPGDDGGGRGDTGGDGSQNGAAPTQQDVQTPAPESLDIPKADFQSLRLDRNDTVLEIIDPLTIRLEKSGIVRLVGIDIPDFSPYSQGPLAESAAHILRDMLAGKTVRLYQTQDKQTGRKNRLNQSLYHVVIDDSGSWVQGVLVRLGLARVRSEPANPEMARALYTLEAQARAGKVGLWAFEPYQVITPEQTPLHLNSYAIVEGKVISAARKQNVIYLNFGQNWRDDFTVSIKSQNIKRFQKGDLNPLDLNGRTVRVRGWLESYNGAHIEIDHPESIEIITP